MFAEFEDWLAPLRRCRTALIAGAAAVILAGCSSTQQDYEGTFTAMVGPQTRLSSTNGYGLAAKATLKTKLDKPYFIEFRARNALSYGHAFVAFGVRDADGDVPLLDKDAKDGVLDPRYVEIAGLHPRSNYVAPFLIGHVVPVPAESGPSDGDFEEKYLLARYRIDLTKSEFDKVVKVIQKHKRQGVFWSGPLYACVHFVSAISRDLGLKNPAGLNLPESWVTRLAQANGQNPRLNIAVRTAVR